MSTIYDQAYQKVAIRALEKLLYTNAIPQPINYFFTPVSSDPAEKHVLEAKGWQFSFMMSLRQKHIVNASVKDLGSKNARTPCSCKNRFFITTLLSEVEAGFGERLFTMIEDAKKGGPNDPEETGIIESDPVLAQAQKRFDVPDDDIDLQSHFEKDTKDIERKPVEKSSETKIPKKMNDDDLKEIKELLTASLAYQESLAENIIYIRDRGDKLHDKVRALADRISTIETKMDIPITIEMPQLENLKVSVNSIGIAVDNMKAEVGQTVEKVFLAEKTGQMSQLRESVTRIASEFDALRDLALEAMGDSVI